MVISREKPESARTARFYTLKHNAGRLEMTQWPGAATLGPTKPASNLQMFGVDNWMLRLLGHIWHFQRDPISNRCQRIRVVSEDPC